MGTASHFWTRLAGLLLVAGCSAAGAATVEVASTAALAQALQSATAGTTILVDPGTYGGDLYLSGIQGTAADPIVVQAMDPSHPPVISGGSEGIHLTDAAYVTLRQLTFTAQGYQAINCDDGGTYTDPGHHDLVFDQLVIHDVGTTPGDTNGIKLSGIDHFVVSNCTITNWSEPNTVGDGIDCVGCHDGVISGSTFSQSDEGTSGGVQTKGGSARIQITGCAFLHAGQRGVQMGGSTGLQFFRPSSAVGYEAQAISCDHCIFIGCDAPVAFTGLDGGSFTNNTVYGPVTWLMRILQEDTVAGMAQTQDVTVAQNIFAFTSSLQTAVNIGSNTLPQTFTYDGNWWYCIDAPGESTPALPVVETDGVVGVDPAFVDAAGGDLHTMPGSPASGVGAYAGGSGSTGTGTTSGTGTGTGTGTATSGASTSGTSGSTAVVAATGGGGGGCGLGAGVGVLVLAIGWGRARGRSGGRRLP